LEVLVDQGLVGLVTFSALLVVGVATAWKTRGEGARAFAALIAFCFAAVLESSFSRRWVVIALFALLGAIARVAITRPSRGPTFP
jgi:hypothetical protein